MTAPEQHALREALARAPRITKKRLALLREIAAKPEGIETRKIHHPYHMAYHAERAGLLTGTRGVYRRWFITEAGRELIAAHEPAPHPSAGPEIAALKRRISELEDEVTRLNDVIRGGVTGAPPSWGLSPSEERLVSALASVFPRVLSVDGILSRAWPDTYPTTKIVDVTVCKARKKLARHGVEIRSLWGRGYSLCENGAAAVRAIGRD